MNPIPSWNEEFTHVDQQSSLRQVKQRQSDTFSNKLIFWTRDFEEVSKSCGDWCLNWRPPRHPLFLLLESLEALKNL